MRPIRARTPAPPAPRREHAPATFPDDPAPETLPPLLVRPDGTPVATPEAWRERRAEIEARWRRLLGPHENAAARRVPNRVLHREALDGGVVRELIAYAVEPGCELRGYLLRPSAAHEPDAKRPGAVVLHSTTSATIRQPAGLDGPPEKHLGLDLARRGWVAFCPECFLWRHSDADKLTQAVDWLRETHPGVTGMAKMLVDAVQALDVVAEHPDVDPRRLAAVGHSLGAKEVLYLAAFDPRVRAAVFSEGGVGLRFSNWDAPWYLGEQIRRPDFPGNHAEVLALVAPRAFLVIGGDSADGEIGRPYIDAVQPVWELLGRGGDIRMFNHRQGHTLPEPARERLFAWIDRVRDE